MVSLGSFKRSLCPDPSPDDLLPTNDKAWDTGDSGSAFQRTVSSPLSEPQSPFARLCQSALIASKGLQHQAAFDQCKLTGERFDLNAVASLTDMSLVLCKAMGADYAASPGSYFSLMAARAANYSVSLKVLSLYASAEPIRGVGADWDEQEMALQMTAMEGSRKTALYVRDFAADLYAFVSLDEDVVKSTPMILEALYLASVAHQSAWKETGDPAAETNFEITRKCLVRLSGRWRLGKEFLDMLEVHDMNYMGSSAFHSSARLAGIPLVVPGMS
jgi:hypothetical protein